MAAPAPPTAGFLTRPGDDFASRGDPRPYLQAHGWTLCGTKSDGNELWTRPGKDPRLGHSATLKDGVFFVFSSNAAPFEPNRGYNAYQVFALLEHANDFKAATAAPNLTRRKIGTTGRRRLRTQDRFPTRYSTCRASFLN